MASGRYDAAHSTRDISLVTIGAAVLPFASYVLQAGGGFQTILVILAAAALLIVTAALILPYQAAGEQNRAPAPQPAE